MRKTKKIIGAFVCLGAIILCSSFLKKMSEYEYDHKAGFNGGFEHVRNGLPVNWYVYTPKTTKNSDFAISFDQQDPREGKQSLVFTVRKCSSAGGRQSPGFSREINAKPGDTFMLSLWVKNSGSKFHVKVSAVNSFHAAPAQTITIAENINNWRQIAFSYTIPKEMDRLRVEVNVLSPGKLHVDNISILQK